MDLIKKLTKVKLLTDFNIACSKTSNLLVSKAIPTAYKPAIKTFH